jgi:hypothetical protein
MSFIQKWYENDLAHSLLEGAGAKRVARNIDFDGWVDHRYTSWMECLAGS